MGNMLLVACRTIIKCMAHYLSQHSLLEFLREITYLGVSARKK